MAAPLTQTLVVQEHDEADETGLSIPVRLVKPDGTPFASNADSATIIAKVNSTLTKLKAAGILA